jgi:hypothetical protein
MSKNAPQIKPVTIPSWIEKEAKALRFVMLSDTHSYRLFTTLFRSLVEKGLPDTDIEAVEEFTHWFTNLGASLRAEWGLVFMYKGLADNILKRSKPFDSDDEYFGGFMVTYLYLNGEKYADKNAKRYADLMAAGWARMTDESKRELYLALLAILTSHAKSELISIGISKGGTEAGILEWARKHSEKKSSW